MCGRYTLTRGSEELVETFDVPDLTFEHVPSFNVAPGQAVPVLAQDRAGRRIGPLVWGIQPSGGGMKGRTFINARSETVARTPSFRESFAVRRCLIPADGFYEWRKDGKAKTPFWFHRPDRGLFTMAAVWDRGGTFAILTTEASDDVRDVHHRMPVVIDTAGTDAWLARETPLEEVASLMAPPGKWARHRVDRRVGSPANDDSGLIEPV